jgi:hypothetical protein
MTRYKPYGGLAAFLRPVLFGLLFGILAGCPGPTDPGASSDASLKSLEISAGTLDPAFDPETRNYAASVGNDVESLTLTARANHAAASLDPPEGTLTKNLAEGSGTVFAITVTAENGSPRTYTVTVTREAAAKSADASLKSLEISAGTLDPAFDPETRNYAASVGNNVESLTLTARANHAAASLDPPEGTLTKNLAEGSGTVFAITVTAENGSPRTYTVTVSRMTAAEESSDASLKSLAPSEGTLDPAFAPGTTEYALAVGNGVASLALQARANNAAASLDPPDGLITRDLRVGSNNVFAIAVTAKDGTSTRTYTVTVTRAATGNESSDAALKSLAISPADAGTLDPPFSPAVTAYTLAVENTVTSLAITAAANHAAALMDPPEGIVAKNLIVGGNNIFAVTVIAEDGATEKTYTVTVTRAATGNESSDAALKSLAISPADAGTLKPPFSPAATAYTLAVGNNIASLTLSAQANHAAAVLDPASGTLTKDLSTGSGNIFAITVTAEDGTPRAYTVTVTRAKSADATLRSLAVSAGTLEPPFSPAATAYTLAVENSVASLTLSAQPGNSAAVLDPASGTLTKDLSVGDTDFSIIVTAEDGTASKTYTVTVSRAAVWGENPGEPLAAPSLVPILRQISVSWPAVTGASAYQVYYGPAGEVEAITKAGNDSLGTSRNITGLEAGASYDVYVRALISGGGNRLSAKGTVTLAPAPPTGLSAAYTGPGEADLTWTASTGALSYQVFYSLGVNESDQAIFRDPADDPIYSFTNLKNGVVYYFWVKAENSGGVSAFSDPAEIAMPVPPPQNIIVSSLNEKLRLNWQVVQGADSYEVQYALSASFSDADKQPAEGDSLTLTGLQNGVEYFVRVRSVHTDGSSDWSAVVNGTPQFLGIPPEVPTVVMAGRSADHSAPRIVLIWNPVNAAEYYEVSYSAGPDPDAGTKIFNITDNACEITTGLVAGTSYNVWVRAANDAAASAWSAAVYPQAPGTGFDPQTYGVYFSRYPYGRAYYMDGYQIGTVSGMMTEFPFNKAEFPSYPPGLPAMFQFGWPQANPRMELVSDYQFEGGDQYIFYNDLNRFGWSYLGIVRMIFEKPNDASGDKTGFVIIEFFKGCEYSSKGAIGGSRYFKIKFTINETGATAVTKEAYDSFRGVNLSELSDLTLSQLKANLMVDNDANVAYPNIRLGSYTGDTDSDFHPSLLPPEPLNRWAPGKTTDEECWPAVKW